MNQQERREALKRQLSHVAGTEEYEQALYEKRRRQRAAMRKREQMRKRRRLRWMLIAVAACVVVVIAAVGVTQLQKSLSSRGSVSGVNNQQPVSGEQEELPAGTSESESGSETEKISKGLLSEEDAAESEDETVATDSGQETVPAETVLQQTEAQTIQEQTDTEAQTVAAVATAANADSEPLQIIENLIHINAYSRPATANGPIRNVVIHYVGNPGSSAMGNRDYFDSLDNPNVVGYQTKASAHFVVGLEGEIVQCIPLNETAISTHNDYNPYQINIEVCHPDWEGKFTDITYASVIKLAAYLLEQYGLTYADLQRHYDVTGKPCPVYYVNNPDAWDQLKEDVAEYQEANPAIEAIVTPYEAEESA